MKIFVKLIKTLIFLTSIVNGNSEHFISGKIVDEKNSKFSTTDFPDNWTANGTWAFTKKGNKCRIDHEDGGMNMTWNC